MQTAKENLHVLLAALQKLPNNITDKIALEEAHRSAHTLKSKSLVMGYQDIGNLARSVEDTMYDVINQKTSLSQDTLQSLRVIAKQIEEKLKFI